MKLKPYCKCHEGDFQNIPQHPPDSAVRPMSLELWYKRESTTIQ